MAERLFKLFSSPKFKENRSYLPEHLRENVSPLSSSSRYNFTQDEYSLDLDAKSDGFTSRICDTANSLLLGEFPWGSEKPSSCVTIKQKKQPTPVPVRLHIDPPNSGSLLLSEADGSEYENEEYNSSKCLLQVLREISRKRTHSLMNEENDNDVDSSATVPKKTCKPVEYRHNLYLSQLEEDTQEFKNNTNNQFDHHLDRGKRGRDEDHSNSNTSMIGLNSQDVVQSKKQRRIVDASGALSSEEHISSMMSVNDSKRSANHNSGTINNLLQSPNRVPRRGSNEIASSLSSSLSLLDPAVLFRLMRPSMSKNRRKFQKKVRTAETQTIQAIPEETTKAKETQNTPKKEDKSMNTDPEKPPRVVEEKQVTDKMANSLIKSAVSKFLATEDPALSPVRNPLPLATASPVEKPIPSIPTSTSIKELLPLPVSTSNVLSSPSNNGLVPSSSTLSLPANGKAINSTFNFEASSNLASNLTIPSTTKAETILPFNFGSPLSSSVTTTTSNNLFTTPIITTTDTNNIMPKLSDTTKPISFGDNKLGNNIGSEKNVLAIDEKNNKPVEMPKTDLFTKLEPPKTTTSETSTSSILSKGTFSFGFPTPSSSPATINSETLKTPTFTFGSSANNVSTPPVFGSTAEKPKATTEQPKISLFGTTSAVNTTKSEEPKSLSAGLVNPIISSGTFQFGASNNDKKADKPEEKKPQGLFGSAPPLFGSVQSQQTQGPSFIAPTSTSSTLTSKPETKPSFTFGASTSNNSAEVTQASIQQPKPIFQFGSSSFSTPQTNIAFGAKPSMNEQTTPAPSFSSSNGLFGAKPATPSTSAPTKTTATTTTGLFSFGSFQPTITTTAPPTFGSSTSTTNSSVGGFSFQPNKLEEKPTTASSSGFAFKFTGTNAAPSSEPAKPSFSFGASNNNQSTTSAFGTSTLATQPTFGSVTPAAPTFPAFSNPTPTPTFRATPAASNPTPAFGSNTAAPTFGAPAAASQPAPPVFGSVQTQQAQGGPSFTFGSTSASNPSSGFNFGASSQSSAQPASSGMFQFGSSANQQNPGGNVQPFQFNAGSAAAPNPQGFGFSSPVGGFNPGVGGGQPMFSIGSGSTAARSRPLRRKK